MGILLDLILLLTPVVITVICYKLGFFKLLSPFRKLAAFLLAWSLKDSALVQATVGKLIKAERFKSFVNGRVKALWGEKIKTAASTDGVSIAERFDSVFGFAGELFANLKSFCISLYDKELASASLTDADPLSEKVENFVLQVTDYVTDAAIHFFVVLSGFILLYIVFSVSFWFAARLLDSIFKDGLFGTLNRTLGGVIGVCYGFLFAWVLSLVFVLILPLVSPIELSVVIDGIGVTEWFYTKFFISRLLGISL